MMRGHSLHLGVPQVDPAVYERRFRGTMHGAEPDARVMRDIAERQGFATTLLLTQDATREALRAWLRDASRLPPEDLLLITYAGHGARFRVPNPDGQDGRDESWCLWDGYVLGEDLHNLLADLPVAMRVLVVSDSCYSGGIIDVPRRADQVIASSHDLLVAGKSAMAATVVLLAACGADKVARGSRDHGRFTSALVDAWNDGRFQGNHEELRTAIAMRLSGQVPVLSRVGHPNPDFEASRPFTP